MPGIGFKAAVYQSGKNNMPLSKLPAGTLLSIPENGTAIQYKILDKNYNSTGNPLISRNSSVGNRAVDTASLARIMSVDGSELDQWLNGDYYSSIDEPIRSLIPPTPVIFASRQSASSPTTIVYSTVNKHVFLLSAPEFGGGGNGSGYSDGSKITYLLENPSVNNMVFKGSWTRTIYKSAANNVLMVESVATDGYILNSGGYNAALPIVPGFCLPSTTKISSKQNSDGSFTVIGGS